MGGEVGKGVAGLPRFADDFGDEQAVAGAAADVFDFGLDDADVDAEAFGQRGEDGFIDVVAEEADFDDGVRAGGFEAPLVVLRQVEALGLRNELFAKRRGGRGEEGADIGGFDQLSAVNKGDFV